jgi:hypothetical protein
VPKYFLLNLPNQRSFFTNRERERERERRKREIVKTDRFRKRAV